MKKAVFGAILASLLMLSMPVVSTVNAGPQLIAKNSSERYVPELVRVMVQEARSMIDRIIELAGDNELIIAECKGYYDLLDDIERGEITTTFPLVGSSSTNSWVVATENLVQDIKEQLGDDVLNEIISQANKELQPLFGPIFGDDFDVSDLLSSGDFHSSGYNDVGPAIPYPGHPVSGDDGDVHFMTSQTPAMPCPIVVGNPSSAGEASTAGWSENCTEDAIEVLMYFMTAVFSVLGYIFLAELGIEMVTSAWASGQYLSAIIFGIAWILFMITPPFIVGDVTAPLYLLLALASVAAIIQTLAEMWNEGCFSLSS